ncbi:hypothetical protein M9Y10_037367 [Tritrichomonas musculus]|uniref:mitogen-activated protein kinase kinase n=1 Tax=Tritrichomonas musculus TaxID=1915356 RepID=A0ABR2GSD6_9EUKA
MQSDEQKLKPEITENEKREKEIENSKSLLDDQKQSPEKPKPPPEKSTNKSEPEEPTSTPPKSDSSNSTKYDISSSKEPSKPSTELQPDTSKQEYDYEDRLFDSSLYKNIDDYEEIRTIGHGGYGDVKEYKHKQTGQHYAFKIIMAIDEQAANSIDNEITTSTLFNEPTLLPLCGIIEDIARETYIIITPFFSNGDLMRFLRSSKKLNLTQKFIILYGVAAGMYVLHKNDIVHRDLKPGNVLLNDSFEPLIGDFGLSKKASKIRYNGKAADVYSFSIFCFILFTGKSPFDDIKDQAKLRTMILNKERPKFPENFNSNVKNLIENCWKENPEERLSFEKILEIIGKKDFIESLGEIDLIKFREYQNKVVHEDRFKFELF